MAFQLAAPRAPTRTQTARLTPDQIRRYRGDLRAEWEAAALYRRLADLDPEPERAEVLRALAAMEDRHAARWRAKLEAAGQPLPAWQPSLRSRALSWLARLFGTDRVIPILERGEANDENMYAAEPAAQDFAVDERTHGRLFARLQAGSAYRGRPSAAQIAAR